MTNKLYYGNNQINKVYLGDKELEQLYLGEIPLLQIDEFYTLKFIISEED